MRRVKIVVLIGLVLIGAVYAGTRTKEKFSESSSTNELVPGSSWTGPEELTREGKNKLLVKVAIGAANEGDWALMAKLYSPRFVQHGAGNAKTITWTEFELAGRTLKQKIPTARFEIIDIVAESDKVVVRGETVVTYKEKHYKSETTTERKIEFAEMDLFRIEGGRIVEEWCEYDTADWKTKLQTLRYVKTWK